MKYLIIFGVLMTAFPLRSQPLQLDKFPVDNSSLDLVGAIGTEVLNGLSDRDSEAFRKKSNEAFLLDSEVKIAGFFSDFHRRIDDTKKVYEQQEFLWRTNEQIKKYGLNVLNAYNKAATSHNISKILQPAIEESYKLYIREEFRKSSIPFEKELDQLAKDRLNLLYSNNVDILSELNESTFKLKFLESRNGLPNFDDQVFSSLIADKAFQFVKSNSREKINLVNLKSTSNYETIKEAFGINLSKYQDVVSKSVTGGFKELGSSMRALMENQGLVFGHLGEIEKRITGNQTTIRIIESEIKSLAKDSPLLRSKLADHRRLLEQNAFQIDILNSYLSQNLDSGEQLKLIEAGKFDKVFNPNQLQLLRNELRDIQTKQTIIGVASAIDGYANFGFEQLRDLNILKGEDAVKVGKFMHGVSILTGAARMYAGDFSGFSSIVSGIGGLSAKPKLSPELAMMKEMFKVINARFDRIDRQLSRIETKMDSLSNSVYKMHKAMAVSFQYTNEQIEKINRKVDYLANQATYLTYKDYNNCYNEYIAWSKHGSSMSYSSILSSFNAGCNKCLSSLNDMLSGQVPQSPFFFSSNPTYAAGDVIDEEINNVYNPTKSFFLSVYRDVDTAAVYSLMFPVELTKDSGKPLQHLKSLKNLKILNFGGVFQNYYNHVFINDVSKYLISFSPFFEVAGNSSDYSPQSLTQYLNNQQINATNRNRQERRLLHLLEIIQAAIAQQSLLSGHMLLDPIYSTLFNATSNNDHIALAIKILKNNKLLATNFSVVLLNRYLDTGSAAGLREAYEQALNGGLKVNDLNSFLTSNDLRFVLDEHNNMLFLSFQRGTEEIRLPVPPFSAVMSKKMRVPDSLYSLLESREQVNSKLIDLTFTRGLNDTDELSEWIKYGLAPSILHAEK